MNETTLFTIGHSNHPIETFLALLNQHQISAIADVRSSPFSRYNPHYNREALARSLTDAGVKYVYLGQELGARRSEPECYRDHQAKYELITHAPLFIQGLDRVRRGMLTHRIALMCSEKDPITCHRTILISRQLSPTIASIWHILEDGTLESQADAEFRLLALCGITTNDLFMTREELIDQAYEIQGDRIAYVARDDSDED